MSFGHGPEIAATLAEWAAVHRPQLEAMKAQRTAEQDDEEQQVA